MHYTMRVRIKKRKFPRCKPLIRVPFFFLNGLISSPYYSHIPYLTRLETRVLIKKVHSETANGVLKDNGDEALQSVLILSGQNLLVDTRRNNKPDTSPPSVFILPRYTRGGREKERDGERDDSITHNPLPLPGDTLHTE